jgi:hypothetical protein
VKGNERKMKLETRKQGKAKENSEEVKRHRKTE